MAAPASNVFSPEQTRTADWWKKTTMEDLKLYLEKNAEYGDADLRIIGQGLKESGVEFPSNVNPVEVGIAFYALGKIARILSAYKEGKTPSKDSWADLTVYSMMGRMAGKEL